jgi:predicted exporter
MGFVAIGMVAAVAGLFRLRFDPDVLGMLPGEMPEVRGLQAFHEGFARKDELILLIEGALDDEGALPLAAESLSAALEESGTVRRARWHPKWEDAGSGLAELLAYLWLNGSPAVASAQSDRFAGAGSQPEAALSEALARVATAMEGEDMVMRANDPFGFLRHPSLEVIRSIAETGATGFESDDGRTHLILVEAPREMSGYRETGQWLEQVQAVVANWQLGDGEGLTVHFTGEPAFSAEIGNAMENDLRGTVGVTAALIGLLFWVAQRRFLLLVGLVAVLGMIFITTLGLAGWLYGELSIMAAGFAAILIGLTVDYGVLICQEAKRAGPDRRKLRRAAGVSISWAAATTAVVFFALNFSGLPGIAQLGTIVACGILTGALMMLWLYLPFVAKVGSDRPVSTGTRGVPSRRLVSYLSIALAAGSAITLTWKGFPGIVSDSQMMRPRDSAAMAGFERLQAQFPAWDSSDLQLVIEAPDDSAMLNRIEIAAGRIAAMENKVERIQMATGWWPDISCQGENKPNLSRLADERERLLKLADEVGFSQEGLGLARAVMEELNTITRQPGPFFPESEAARDLMRMFVARDPAGGGKLLARVIPKSGVDPAGGDYEGFRKLSGDGIWLTGWSLLRPALAPLVYKNLIEVFLPMAGMMVLMLGMIFRSAREVARILLAMLASTFVLLAAMAALEIKWNFLNIAATPLLLGTGIDYGIHVMLALRRNGGDIAVTWHGTGKAVLFCGCSTAIGFGSLCFASNEAMTSLGTIAVIGILSSMLISVFLLPGWCKPPTAPAPPLA